MRAPQILPIKAQDFTARATTGADNVLTVKLTGNADLNVKTDLDRFLRDLHSETGETGTQEIRVDVRALEFMNSSCLKGFVNWILSVQEQPPDRQYRITFISNAAMQWQRRSLHALSSFASDLVTVQT